MLDLSQAEADALLAMEKIAADSDTYDFPGVASGVTIPLVSRDGREDFFLDLRRGRIDLSKATYQNRARRIVILARLDLAGPPHTNPDGARVECPHLHLYREGFGDKWAFDVPATFTSPGDLWRTLEDFMEFCNVTEPPTIQRSIV